MDLKMPSLVESLGLRPVPERFRQAMVALRGAPDVPPSRYDRTSLSILSARLAVPLWRGRFVVPRMAILTNLFNHRQTPISQGWSVRRTQTEDFRGGNLTYDSHNGTDFCIPRGTTVVAAASGEVIRILSEFNRGGLKLIIDHGDGLVTCCAHLARVVVREGQRVVAGEAVAVSGYSGLDGLVTFPWGIPHVHFNTWLNGEPVDPFAVIGGSGAEPQVSLWRGGEPIPAPTEKSDQTDASPSQYNEARVDLAISSCLTTEVRERLAALSPLAVRGAHTVIERNYYPSRFPEWPNVYERTHVRNPCLWMPFSAADFDGAVFADALPARP